MKDYWELCRPFTLLAPAIGMIAFAFAGFKGQTELTLLEALPLILLGAFSAAALNAASNIVNQYYDLAIDRINKPNRPLPSGRVPVTNAMILCVVCYILSIIAAYLVNRQFFWIVLLTALITYSYSGPPFRTKQSWWLANLTIAIPRGCLLVVAGWTIVRSVWDFEIWIIGAVFGLYVLGAATTKDFADIEGDRAGGCFTLPVRFGIVKSAWMISPFFVLPFLLLLYASIIGWLEANRLVMITLSIILCLWGAYVAYLIVRKPSELATEANHVSWKHMYLIMVAGQLGTVAAYWIPSF